MTKIWKSSRAVATGQTKNDIFRKWNRRFHEDVNDGNWSKGHFPSPTVILKEWRKHGGNETTFRRIGTIKAYEALKSAGVVFKS